MNADKEHHTCPSVNALAKEGAHHDRQSAARAATNGSATPAAAEHYRDRQQGALNKLHCSTAAWQLVRKQQ
jgi:hypothetical protein